MVIHALVDITCINNVHKSGRGAEFIHCAVNLFTGLAMMCQMHAERELKKKTTAATVRLKGLLATKRRLCV